MVTKSLLASAALLLAAGSPAWGQAAKPATAEAKAAMERAERLAANPMKIILQASKIRRKGEPAAEPADVATAARPASRVLPASAGVAVAAPATAATAATPAAVREGAPLTRSLAVAPAAPAPRPAQSVAAAPPAAEPADETQPKLMPASLPPGAAAMPMPAIDAAPAAVETAPATAKALAPQAVPAAALVARPTLVSMVEPDIPARVLSAAGRVGEVIVDLSLRPDGGVGGVAFVSPVPRNWKSYITTALEQWRFAPLPNAVVHRVQLVFDER